MAVERGQRIPRLDPVDNPIAATPTVKAFVSVDTPVVYVIKIASLIIFTIAGIVLNYIVIRTIFKHRKYHRAPFYHMISLSLADMARAVITLPLSTASVGHQRWPFSQPACKLSALTNTTLQYAALFSVLAFAVDRHISVVHHRYYERRVKEHRSFISVMLIWACALLIAFPPLFHFGNYVFSPAEAQCTLEYRFLHNNDTLSFLLVIVLAMGAMGVVYSRIYVFMRAHRRMRPISHTPAASNDWTFFGPGATGQAITNWIQGFGSGPPHPAVIGLRTATTATRFQNFRSCKNEHLTRMFVIVTLVYMFTWLPYIAVAVWRLFVDQGDVPDVILSLVTWMSYTQVFCVPLIYIVCNGAFRRDITAKDVIYIQGEARAALTAEA